MKLILASDYTFLLKYGYDLTGIPKDQMKIGYVTTASKGARKFSQRVQETIMSIMKENGYFIEEIDIKNKSKNELRILRDRQGVLVENGKYTFIGDGEEVKLS